jgi:polyhydroxyalkanoate synthesis regulator phasin
VAIPIFFGYLQKSRETVCLNNRAAARRMLLSEQILTQATTLQEIAETPDGKDILSQYECPSGGKIYVEGDSVKCNIHNDGNTEEEPIPEENPYANLSPAEKADKFIDLASKLGELSKEILGEGEGSIEKINENIKQMQNIIQNKTQSVPEENLTKINQLADEINTIAGGLNDVPKTVQDEINQLGTSIQYDNLTAAGTYEGTIKGYVNEGATQAAGEEAANKAYPNMLNTLDTNLPTLGKVTDQLTECKGKITTINQKLSEINTLLEDK